MEMLVRVDDSDDVTVGSRTPTRSSRLRCVVAVLGRLLIALGAVLLLFVAYQLWGTGLREAASQRELRARFEQELTAGTPSPPSRQTATTAEPAAEAGAQPDEPHAQDGDAVSPDGPVAILRIPKLGLDKVVVEGTDVASLRKGPGHEPGTALPGMPGNAVIAGHRTTYGAPFYRLDELAAGDPIVVETPSGTARYVVAGTQVVDPGDVWILEPTDDDRLTLFTCTPRYSAARRLVVTARLESAPPAPPAPTAPASPHDDGAAQPAAAPAAASPPAPSALAAPETLAAPSGSLPGAVAWAAATALGMAVIWWAGRRWRRIVVYPLGAPILAVVLFVTFEKVAALLPAAV